jgi:protocatechuate 3,4-dioxygenase beta subunit
LKLFSSDLIVFNWKQERSLDVRLKIFFVAIFVAICFVGISLSGAASTQSKPNPLAEKARRVRTFERHWKHALFKGDRSVRPQKSVRAEANTGSVSGTVSGLDSSAVGTAYVEAFPVSKDTLYGVPYTSGAAAVNPNFTYTIEGLRPGAYFVYAYADGYESVYYNDARDFSEADTVKVRENEEVRNINLNLAKMTPGTGSISGVVLDAKNENPIPQAVVYVFASEQPFYYGKSEVDEQGRFAIGELKSGSYIAEVYAEGYIQEIYDDADSYETTTVIEVIEPNETSGIRFLLDRGGTISGTVLDNEGRPIPNVWVEASAGAGPDSAIIKYRSASSLLLGGYASTDENGAYRITGLPVGEYIVRAEAWVSWYQDKKWYDDVRDPSYATKISVHNDEEVAGVDFRFDFSYEFGVISGKVTDIDGHPVVGAGVQIFTNTNSSTGYPYWYLTTDSDGFYRADNVPAGQYIVSCWAQVGWQYVYRYWQDAENYDQASPVTVEGNSSNEKIDFRLPVTVGTSVIEGVVRSSGGRLLANANIQVSAAPVSTPGAESSFTNLWAYANSDSFGRYHVDQLPADSYIVRCSYWEGISYGQQWYNGAETEEAATPVVLSGHEKRNGVDFNLDVHPIYGTLSGTVTDAQTGKPISRAYVEVRLVRFEGQTYWFRWWNTSAVTDENGQYKLEWMSEGEYLVSVYADCGFAYYKNAIVPDLADTVQIVGGETAVADIALHLRNDGPGAIRGRVTAEFGYSIFSDSLKSSIDSNRRGSLRIEKVLEENPIDLAVVIARPSVTILSWPESERFYNTLSSKDGMYELRGLPEGEYYVQSFTSGYMPEYYNDVFDPSKATLVKVEGDVPAEGIDFSLPPMLFYCFAEDGMKNAGAAGASINGKVTDANGKPLSDAVVYLLNGAGQPMASSNTNPDGSYAIHGVTSGNYYVQASKLGFATVFNGNAGKICDTKPVFVGNGTLEIDLALPEGGSGVRPNPNRLPKSATLYPNYPNPFNPTTTIRFSLPDAGRVRIVVFDLFGREIRTLWNGPAAAGMSQVTWDAKDASGERVASGMYFYRLESHKEVRTGKMLYLK